MTTASRSPFNLRQYLIAPANTEPDEPPANIPSCFTNCLAHKKNSLSLARSIQSTTERSVAEGRKSSPIPSTLYVFGYAPSGIFPLFCQISEDRTLNIHAYNFDIRIFRLQIA